MRHLLTGLVVLVATVILPTLALAGNQEIANEIATNLRESGQLSNYKVAVKYQDGTAWLEGRVASQEQMNVALRSVFRTSQVDRVVNNLNIGQAEVPRPVTPKPVAPKPVVTEPVAPKPVVTTPVATKAPARIPVPAPQAAAQPVVRAASAAMPRRPIPIALTQAIGAPMGVPMGAQSGGPMPSYVPGTGGGVAPARYDQAHMPNYAWPSYSAYPNYGALTYPRQHSPTAWPYIGSFYPYPQVPLGWRKVTLEWDDGWWMLDFKD